MKTTVRIDPEELRARHREDAKRAATEVILSLRETYGISLGAEAKAVVAAEVERALERQLTGIIEQYRPGRES